MKDVPLSTAIRSFLFSKSAAGRSAHTITNYNNYLKMLSEFLGDPQVSKVNPQQIREFMVHMRDEHRLRRAGVETDQHLSRKTLANVQTMLITFWKWAAAEYGIKNPCNLDRINATDRPVLPLSEDEVQRLLQAIDTPFRASRSSTRDYEFHSRTRKRDRALVLALLDTGCRATELCDALIRDLDVETGRVRVVGKGSKERFVYLGKKAKGAVWTYLMDRYPRGKLEPDDPLFMDDKGRDPLNRDSLRHMLVRLGKRAKITGTVHPHRFRHTFAVQFLVNGGDVFTLQQLLGHTSLVMVRRYVQMSRVDVEKIHKRASPADNWHVR